MPSRSVFASILLLSSAALLAAIAGCAPARSDTFDIEVHNKTQQPLTLSLAKSGPPYEATWATPEDLAIESPHRREEWKNTKSGIMGPLLPDKTAYVDKLAGRFEGDAEAFLRVYAGGDLTISQMLSRTQGSPDRVDVPLHPGKNEITIIMEATHLKAENGPAVMK